MKITITILIYLSAISCNNVKTLQYYSRSDPKSNFKLIKKKLARQHGPFYYKFNSDSVQISTINVVLFDEVNNKYLICGSDRTQAYYCFYLDSTWHIDSAHVYLPLVH